MNSEAEESEVIVYRNSDQKVIYKKTGNFEEWFEYDEWGNTIHYKDSNGYEWWQEFNKEDKIIHYKTSVGFQFWREYNADGNVVYIKDIYNLKVHQKWTEYDKKGNPTKVTSHTVQTFAN